MKSGQIRNMRTGELVADQLFIADTFWTRFRGLLGRSVLPPSEGLWLKPCKQVHMWGMKFPLSIWYLDSTDHVCAMIEELRPWRRSPLIAEASSILEFPAGWGKRTKTQLGDKLVWEVNSFN